MAGNTPDSMKLARLSSAIFATFFGSTLPLLPAPSSCAVICCCSHLPNSGLRISASMSTSFWPAFCLVSGRPSCPINSASLMSACCGIFGSRASTRRFAAGAPRARTTCSALKFPDRLRPLKSSTYQSTTASVSFWRVPSSAMGTSRNAASFARIWLGLAADPSPSSPLSFICLTSPGTIPLMIWLRVSPTSFCNAF